MEYIKMIKISKLHPHPNNPRKELGDLTELAESIKKSGIMQNLTVVPYGAGDEYTVIIGHRRRAAAKLAGLTELPCVITEMSEREQLATMLAENMQRNDLTVLEQADGIQLMLDFGDSIEEVAEATGLSESTVRRRAKIAKYDRKAVRESFERGATLFDYEELEKVKDKDRRESLLEYIGTPNFKWKLNSAISDEKDNEWLDAVEKEVSTFAEETECDEGLEYTTSYRTWRKEEVKIPMPDRKYFYVRKSDRIVLYSEVTDDEKAENDAKVAADKERELERDKKIAELERLGEIAYESRKNFISAISSFVKLRDVVIRFALWRFACRNWYGVDEDDFKEVYGREGLEATIAGTSDIPDANALFIAAYCTMDDCGSNSFHKYKSTIYEKNEELEKLYDFLVELGYEISDEERALIDGTHSCYEGEDKA